MSKNNSNILCKTGFEPEIVLISVRTMIEAFKKEFSLSNAKYSADLSAGLSAVGRSIAEGRVSQRKPLSATQRQTPRNSARKKLSEQSLTKHRKKKLNQQHNIRK